MNVNGAIVTEYVELCERLAAQDAVTEQRLYARLDQLWYAEMTDTDRAAAEEQLGVKNRAWHEVRRTEDP